MKKEIHSYSLIILGDNYTVASDESEDHVVESANYVHTLLKEYVEKAPHIPLKTVAVLAALKLASTVLKYEATLQEQATKHDSLVSIVEGQIKRITMQG